MRTLFSRTVLLVGLCTLLFSGASLAQTWLDNNREWSTSSLNPNVNSRSSDHFRVFWGNADNPDPTLNTDFNQVSEQLAQGNLQMLEIEWHILHDPIASGGLGIQAPAQSLNPAYQDGNSYRDTLGMNQTGLWGGGAWGGVDGWGFPIFGLPPSYLRFDPPSGATPHEYGHTVLIQTGAFDNTPYDGMWHEAFANWQELQIDNDYPGVGSTVYAHAGSLPHGRDYYDAWPIWEFFKDDPRWGPSFINTVITQGHGDQSKYNPAEYIFDAMARLDTSGAIDKFNDIKDALGACNARCLNWDFQRKQLFQPQAPITSDFYSDYYRRGFTELEKRPGSVANGNQSAWYRVPWAAAPSQGGFDFIPIALNSKTAGGYQVGVNFQPLWDSTRGSDWRATFVAINNNNECRYSKMWNCGTNYITLSADENKLYLVVAATPRMLGFEGFSHPLLADPILQPQAFEIAFVNTQAGAYESNPAASQSHSGMTQHANGGGWKSTSATVDSTAYIGPNALVLGSAQVRGNARVEDYAVVRDSAQVRDNAIVSGHALVKNSAQVYGNARIRDWATVINGTQVYGNGKVLQGAYADNDNIRDSAVVKGWTYDYVDGGQTIQGVYGYGIKEGDCANGSTLSKGVLTCWVWGFDQNYADSRPDNGWRYCEYSFENYSPIFAKDTYGIIHGYLMGGTTKPTTVASDNTARGQVLSLNGTDQYVELHKDVCDFVDCTVSTWVKWNGGSSDQVIWSMGDGANKYMTLTAKGSTSQLRFAITNSGSGGETALTTTGLTAGAWTHLAITFSSGSVTLYRNGTLVASGASTLRPCDLMGPNTVNGGNCNYIGRGNSGNYFAGQIDLFAVYMKALNATEVAAIAANAGSTTSIPPQTDATAPTPNAPTWLQSPTALDEASIQMSSNVGTDDSGSVEYYFTCIYGGGHDSGWISSNRYTDCGLTPGTSCTYTVKMRDRYGNTTATSVPATVSTLADSGAPTPNPATFAYGPIGASATSITMTATKGTCSGGLVEYNFTRDSSTSSGWQSSPNYTFTGLASGSSHTFTVQMRNVRGATGTMSAASASVTAADNTPPTLYALGEWTMRPYATIDNCISMTARTISDSGGVQYSFECTSGGGPSSGWQDSSTYKTAAQPDGTYTYLFRVRQKNATANVSGYSQSWNATINPTTGYHTCTISQLPTLQDHYLASFNGTVMRVNADNYYIKDLSTGASITVRPNAVRCATDLSLALKNVSVKGHLFTYSSGQMVTYATVTSTGSPTLNTISGKVSNVSGTGISGATIYLSDTPNAIGTYITTATTDSSGNYSAPVTPGTWYVAAGHAVYNTAAEQVVTVTNANVSGINFTLVANAIVSGKVTKKSDGTAISGASVYFSTSPNAASSPIFTATTNSSGNYSQPVQNGSWYVAAGGTNYYTSVDQAVVVSGTNIPGINFTLKSNTRNVPDQADLLFWLNTDSLPASGAISSWPVFAPSGSSLSAIGTPTVETIDGMKWEKNNRMSSTDGFRFGGEYTSPLAVNGVTIVAVVKPTYCSPGGEARGEVVDFFYGDLFLAVGHSDGEVIVCRRSYSQSGTGYHIPDGQKTVLSLVVTPQGTLTLYADGVQKWSQDSGVDYTTLQPGSAGFMHYIDVGRNDPDGWSAYNGNIGDVLVYKTALSNTDRQTLEWDLYDKFAIGGDAVTISGKVLDASHGNAPVPGAQVSVQVSGVDVPTAAAVTDANGNYTALARLNVGDSFTVHATAMNYQAGDSTPPIAYNGSTNSFTGVNVLVEAITMINISGTVSDPVSGLAVPGLKLIINVPDLPGNYPVTTGSDGSYNADVAAGFNTYIIGLDPTNSPMPVMLTGIAARTITAPYGVFTNVTGKNLLVTAKGDITSLRGVVRDAATHSPIYNAAVQIGGKGGPAVVTGADGKFAFTTATDGEAYADAVGYAGRAVFVEGSGDLQCVIELSTNDEVSTGRSYNGNMEDLAPTFKPTQWEAVPWSSASTSIDWSASPVAKTGSSSLFYCYNSTRTPDNEYAGIEKIINLVPGYDYNFWFSAKADPEVKRWQPMFEFHNDAGDAVQQFVSDDATYHDYSHMPPYDWFTYFNWTDFGRQNTFQGVPVRVTPLAGSTKAWYIFLYEGDDANGSDRLPPAGKGCYIDDLVLDAVPQDLPYSVVVGTAVPNAIPVANLTELKAQADQDVQLTGTVTVVSKGNGLFFVSEDRFKGAIMVKLNGHAMPTSSYVTDLVGHVSVDTFGQYTLTLSADPAAAVSGNAIKVIGMHNRFAKTEPKVLTFYVRVWGHVSGNTISDGYLSPITVKDPNLGAGLVVIEGVLWKDTDGSVVLYQDLP